MSGPNFSSVVLPATSIASVVDSSAVVSAIGTSWNQDPSLPGCRPMRTNCALMYSTVFSPPGVPGPRPSNSSEASVFTSWAKSAAVMSSLKVYAGAVAAAGGGAVVAGAVWFVGVVFGLCTVLTPGTVVAGLPADAYDRRLDVFARRLAAWRAGAAALELVGGQRLHQLGEIGGGDVVVEGVRGGRGRRRRRRRGVRRGVGRGRLAVARGQRGAGEQAEQEVSGLHPGGPVRWEPPDSSARGASGQIGRAHV